MAALGTRSNVTSELGGFLNRGILMAESEYLLNVVERLIEYYHAVGCNVKHAMDVLLEIRVPFREIIAKGLSIRQHSVPIHIVSNVVANPELKIECFIRAYFPRSSSIAIYKLTATRPFWEKETFTPLFSIRGKCLPSSAASFLPSLMV
ncbi:hypothetical protein RRF57_011044 [Xylaria bambusicola]|uniref:Uncharacterized protein n=1 Tax=Xylaria bambusicola TaxID=326684 RepID=A0AAN7Z9V9_9PEZI